MPIKRAVIKYGGHAMDEPQLSAAFTRDLAGLAGQGLELVVVHGGGPYINAMLDRLSIASGFVDGLRVTGEEAMQAVEMVLCGQVNKNLTATFEKLGLRCAGVSGRDGGLLRARVARPELGLVGDVTGVDTGLLACLLAAGYMPVVAPVAAGPEWQALNVNADTAAGAIAAAMRADCFILVSDVPGVLGADGRVIPLMGRADIDGLREAGIIKGGMLPKLDACLRALDGGAKSAIILDGRVPGALGRAIAGNAPGTLVAG